jgi:hypothetical protein
MLAVTAVGGIYVGCGCSALGKINEKILIPVCGAFLVCMPNESSNPFVCNQHGTVFRPWYGFSMKKRQKRGISEKT